MKNGFKWDKKYLYWGVTAFSVIICCIAFFWLIQRWAGFRGLVKDIKAVLSPFITGGAIAYLLTPIVKVFERKLIGKPAEKLFKNKPQKVKSFARGMSIFLALILMIAFIASLFSMIIPQLYASIESIVLNASGSIDKLINWAAKWLDDFPEFEYWFIKLVGDAETELTNWAKNTLLPQMQDIVTSVSIGVVSVAKAIVNLFVAVVVSIYCMHSKEKFIAQGKKLLYSLLPVRYSNKVMVAMRYTNKSFMSFISGRLLDALIIGIVCYFGCLFIGIKDSLLIAVLVGVTNVIPFFGPFIGAIPSAIIVLMYSPLKCLIFVIFIIVLQQIDGNIIGPRIVGNVTGLSSFWVLFAILMGSFIFGPVGMLIGVPLFAVIYAGISELVEEKLESRGLPKETDVYMDLNYIDPDSQKAVFFKSDGEQKNTADADKPKEADKPENDKS